MRIRDIAWCAAILTAAAAVCSCSSKQPQLPPPAAVPALTSADIARRWEAAGALTKQHELLKQFVGTWKTTIRSLAGPVIPKGDAHGTAKVSLILGGRYLKEDYQGRSKGKSFNGFGLIGFDNVRGQYISIWTDTLSTAMMSASGSYDEAAKTLNWETTYTDPVSGFQKRGRSVGKLISPKHYSYEMSELLADGTEVKLLTIDYRKIN